MSSSETVTLAGRILRGQWLRGDPVKGVSFIAVGSGDWVDKNNPPLVSVGASGLTNELARKQIQRAFYLEKDNVNGTIFWKENFYREVAFETTIIALEASFGPDEAVGFQICEEGVFAGNVTTIASPYALVAEVTSLGTLYWVRNRSVRTKEAGEVFTATAIFEER